MLLLALDLVLCDLWGPTPIMYTDGFICYIIFVNDYSRFIWVYPLKSRTEVSLLFRVLWTFSKLSFHKNSKPFKVIMIHIFFNYQVHDLFVNNRTFHHIYCSYTSHQNGHAKRKEYHFTEMSLVVKCSCIDILLGWCVHFYHIHFESSPIKGFW